MTHRFESRNNLTHTGVIKSREIKNKSEFISISRTSGDSSMAQLDTIVFWSDY